MARVMAVTFVEHGQLHYLDPGEGQWRVGDQVLYPTESGAEVCTVVWAPEWVDVQDDARIPVCAGRASEADLARDRDNRARRAEGEAVARRLVAEHGLPMKVLAVDVVDTLPGVDRQVVVWFSAPGRVDFRALVGELARALSARIDLRQVSARDATQLTGGIGSCGRELCCSTWMREVEPVSMKLAKVQGLGHNPLAIQGQCGKLMCCLKFEDACPLAKACSSAKVPEPVEGSVQGRKPRHKKPRRQVGESSVQD